MGKFKKEESIKEKWEPTRAEVDSLRQEIKRFTSNNPFEEYMIFKNILRYKNGELFVLDHNAYSMYLKINAYRESLDYYDRERMFEQFPEEREIFLQKFKDARKEFKKMAV